MRSRYTAYATGVVDYVVGTHDLDTAKDVDRDSIAEWSSQSKWLGLRIVATEAGGSADDTGMVEFIARFERDGAVVEHHERSTFRRLDGRWLFVDGEMVKARPIVRATPKVGRNEPCPCGSGKKYKQCHGR
jgi:SEC-C motif-containing protein